MHDVAGFAPVTPVPSSLAAHEMRGEEVSRVELNERYAETCEKETKSQADLALVSIMHGNKCYFHYRRQSAAGNK